MHSAHQYTHVRSMNYGFARFVQIAWTLMQSIHQMYKLIINDNILIVGMSFVPASLHSTPLPNLPREKLGE